MSAFLIGLFLLLIARSFPAAGVATLEMCDGEKNGDPVT
jgi:hypothetical protein